MIQRIVIAIVLVSLAFASRSFAAPAGLDIHFIDTEGGAATLIVTPAGESVLIDCGNPGKRDAERIHKAAEAAGLKQIDHLVITHWHSDHYGGIDRLATLIPIKAYYDHGVPDSLSEDKKGFATLIQPYKDFSKGKSRTLKPGDEITLKQADGKPAVKLLCLCADGKVLADKPDAPANAIAKDHKAKPDDTSDNARSVGFVLSYGGFRFLDLGDLTWNIEYKLVHPSDKIGLIDVYQVTHHGLDISNNPVLINTVKPRVAICNNGARKGAAAFVIATLKRVEGIEAIYQLHKNLTVGEAENTDAAFIANKEAECKGEGISLSVAADGKSYTVKVGSDGKPKEYRTRGREMIHLYHDAEYVFRFADCRSIKRFHLEGAVAGARVSVFRIEPQSRERVGLLATGIVDCGGWVEVAEPIIVQAGDAFVAVPDDLC